MGSHDAEEELQIQVMELEAEVERLKELLSEVNRVNDGRVKELEAEVERLKAEVAKKYEPDPDRDPRLRP